MYLVLLLLITSALFGLVTGFVFRVWANLMVAPVIAVVATLGLRFDGFGFVACVSVTVGCLFTSQVTYLIGSFLAGGDISDPLAREAFDDEPDNDGQHAVGGEQEKRDERPSRPPSPET